MSRTTRSVEEKYSIVLESLQSSSTVQSICNKYGITQTTFYKWRDKFLDGAKTNLENNYKRKKSNDDKSRIEELEKLVGKKSLQLEILKKTLKMI
jgi:putative transposase